MKSPSRSIAELIITPPNELSKPHLGASSAELTVTKKREEQDSRERQRRAGRRGRAPSICVGQIVSEIWGMLIGDNVLRGRYGPTRRRHNGIKEEFIITAVLGGGERNPEGRRPSAELHNRRRRRQTLNKDKRGGFQLTRPT